MSRRLGSADSSTPLAPHPPRIYNNWVADDAASHPSASRQHSHSAVHRASGALAGSHRRTDAHFNVHGAEAKEPAHSGRGDYNGDAEGKSGQQYSRRTGVRKRESGDSDFWPSLSSMDGETGRERERERERDRERERRMLRERERVAEMGSYSARGRRMLPPIEEREDERWRERERRRSRSFGGERDFDLDGDSPPPLRAHPSVHFDFDDRVSVSRASSLSTSLSPDVVYGREGERLDVVGRERRRERPVWMRERRTARRRDVQHDAPHPPPPHPSYYFYPPFYPQPLPYHPYPPPSHPSHPQIHPFPYAPHPYATPLHPFVYYGQGVGGAGVAPPLALPEPPPLEERGEMEIDERRERFRSEKQRYAPHHYSRRPPRTPPDDPFTHQREYQAAVTLQRVVRGWLARRAYKGVARRGRWRAKREGWAWEAVDRIVNEVVEDEVVPTLILEVLKSGTDLSSEVDESTPFKTVLAFAISDDLIQEYCVGSVRKLCSDVIQEQVNQHLHTQQYAVNMELEKEIQNEWSNVNSLLKTYSHQGKMTVAISARTVLLEYLQDSVGDVVSSAITEMVDEYLSLSLALSLYADVETEIIHAEILKAAREEAIHAYVEDVFLPAYVQDALEPVAEECLREAEAKTEEEKQSRERQMTLRMAEKAIPPSVGFDALVSLVSGGLHTLSLSHYVSDTYRRERVFDTLVDVAVEIGRRKDQLLGAAEALGESHREVYADSVSQYFQHRIQLESQLWYREALAEMQRE